MDRSDLTDLRCPRWEELPDLGLYMDQVLLVVEDALRPLCPEDGSVLTSTMVNNYVKQGVLAASEKKKYRREHLARLIEITILKRVLSVAEIRFLLERLDRDIDPQGGYDLFRTQLERGLRGESGAEGCDPLLRFAVDAVAGKLRFEAACAAVRPEEASEGKKKKKNAAEPGRD